MSAIVAAAAIAGFGTTAWGAGTSASGSTPPHETCPTVKGPFRVSGDQVLAANGEPFVSYGMTVGGLQRATYTDNLRIADDDRIDAAVRSWCVNTIRLQLQQDDLVGAGVSPSQATAYLTDIKGEVSRAEGHHMVVVLNDQTEGNSIGAENGPTGATLAFWHKLVDVYGRDPQVILDIFNEPRVTKSCSTGQDWQIWQRGTAPGINGFLGMQQVVDAVRGDRARNLIWAEGPCWGATLAHVMEYPLKDPANRLVYDFHHPAGQHDTKDWNADFGYLIDGNLAPVVDGEWTNRSAGDSTNCWEQAQTVVPAYLSYLASRGIGLVGFQLTDHFLLKSSGLTPADLADANVIDSSWHCDRFKLDEGAGTLLMRWFKSHDVPHGG